MVINTAAGCPERFWRLHPFNTWVVSPHLAEFWAVGWSWWPPRWLFALAPGAAMNHISTKLHWQVWSGAGITDPLLGRLRKVRAGSTSAGRAHVGGSADGCCCWNLQICMLLLWGEGCSSIRLATASPRQKCCSWAREIIMRWIWIESALPLDLLPRQSSTAWCPPVWRGKIISTFPGLHTCLYCLVPTTRLIIVPTTQSLIMISLPLLSTPSWLTGLVSEQRNGPVYSINKYTSFLFVLWR